MEGEQSNQTVLKKRALNELIQEQSQQEDTGDELLFSKKLNKEYYFKLDKYKGKDYIHIRKFFKPRESDRLVPSKEGIMLDKEALINLYDAIERSQHIWLKFAQKEISKKE